MPGTEILIKPEIDLVAIDVRARSLRRFCTVLMTCPSKSGCVQSVTRGEVVRHRHSSEECLNPSGSVEAGAKWISGEEVDRLQIARSGCRLKRTPRKVHRGGVRDRISVLNPGEISEEPLSRLRGQNRPNDRAALCDALPLIQNEEERLVLDDRSAYTAADLVPVQVIRFNASEIG